MAVVSSMPGAVQLGAPEPAGVPRPTAGKGLAARIEAVVFYGILAVGLFTPFVFAVIGWLSR